MAEDGTTDGGNCASTEIAAGGINERIYIYNIDDVENLQFENDMRFDNNLVIDTIITSAPFYFIDVTEATYNETTDGNKHKHTLTLTVANTQSVTEDTLSDALGNNYLVAFRNKGGDFFRVFGWKEGATLSYTMDMDSDTNSYTITLEDESEYPLMTCYPDNFNLSGKVYTPVFRPLYDVSYCEQSGGINNGYVIASYVVKVNSAGMALDEDNKLCSYSKKKQCAYKYSKTVSDGDYDIIGIYEDNAVFDGLPVKVFDPSLCPIDAKGTITVSPSTIRLNSYTTSSNLSVTSSNPWKLFNTPTLTSVNPTSGTTSGSVSVMSNGIGGDETLYFQNRSTYERVEVRVQVRIIKCQQEYSFDNSVKEFDIPITAEGGSEDFTYSVDRTGLTITKSKGNLHCVVSSTASDFRTFTITVRHTDDSAEYKYIAVNLQGVDTNPIWQLVNQYCETN